MKTLPSAVRHAALGIQEMDHLKPKVEPISAHLKPILDSIRGGIQNGQTTNDGNMTNDGNTCAADNRNARVTHEGRDASGWRYGGVGFSNLVKGLREQIQTDLEKHSLHVSSVCDLSRQ